MKYNTPFRFKGQNTTNSPAMPILKDGLEVCKELGYDGRIGAGTALGLYRDGKFIDHDTDVDIEIFGAFNPEVFKEKMREKGFIIFKEAADQICFYRENMFVIDILHFREMPDYWLALHPEIGEIKVLKEHLGQFKCTLMDLPCFDDMEGYLEYRYGKNWKIPMSGNYKDYAQGECFK